MMNQKAAELGCQDSHFNNTNGLPDENHYVSAYDMALISPGGLSESDLREKSSGRNPIRFLRPTLMRIRRR